MRAASGLTEKQEIFCNEYLVDLNATQAAKRAEYSPDTAYSIGYELLKKPEIQARIMQIRAETGKNFNITRERIAQEYARLAFFDIRKIHEPDGAIKQVVDFGDDEAAAIAGMEVEEFDEGEVTSIDDFGNLKIEAGRVGRLKKVKLADKRAALDSLCKLMGFNTPEKIAITDPEGNALTTPLISVTTINPGVPMAANEQDIQDKDTKAKKK